MLTVRLNKPLEFILLRRFPWRPATSMHHLLCALKYYMPLFLHSIENTLLMQEKDFETPDGARAPMDVAEFYDSLETKRLARLDGLVQQYNSIESLLIKVRKILPERPSQTLCKKRAQTMPRPQCEEPFTRPDSTFLVYRTCWRT